MKKIRSIPAHEIWLDTKGAIEVWGWYKDGKEWKYRVREIKMV